MGGREVCAWVGEQRNRRAEPKYLNLIPRAEWTEDMVRVTWSVMQFRRRWS